MVRGRPRPELPAASGPPSKWWSDVHSLTATCSTLFEALDTDGDGLLDQREFFAFATALALMGPAWPVPAGASSCSAPGWARVFKDLAAAHAAPPGGFDLTAFGRVVTVGPTGGAGGFRLSDEALLELASFLSASGVVHGPAPPAGRPPRSPGRVCATIQREANPKDLEEPTANREKRVAAVVRAPLWNIPPRLVI